MRHKELPIFSVQYHPEASPGPHDASYLFERFTELMKEFKRLAPLQQNPFRKRKEVDK
ncbi:MAG: hypothetical protein QME42_11635 [bacterium]|nr:hypothetical protein [bacterium]